MSVREDDNQKNCPSRGLGLAAAAIGVGVGAALYYFFSKGPENPTASGSTSGAWHSNTFRDRSKAEEQCSICFDVIQPGQEGMSLPCTHFFHTTCILPWLQEQQTCPNCRKNVD